MPSCVAYNTPKLETSTLRKENANTEFHAKVANFRTVHTNPRFFKRAMQDNHHATEDSGLHGLRRANHYSMHHHLATAGHCKDSRFCALGALRLFLFYSVAEIVRAWQRHTLSFVGFISNYGGKLFRIQYLFLTVIPCFSYSYFLLSGSSLHPFFPLGFTSVVFTSRF